MSAMASKPDKGTLRESFVLSQLEAVASVEYPPQGDFLVDRRFLLEVGGARKKYRQIADIPDSFLAVDDLEIGRGNRIPIWLFGFLY